MTDTTSDDTPRPVAPDQTPEGPVEGSVTPAVVSDQAVTPTADLPAGVPDLRADLDADVPTEPAVPPEAPVTAAPVFTPPVAAAAESGRAPGATRRADPVAPVAPAPRRTPVGALLVTGLIAAACGGAIALWLDQRSPTDLTALQDRIAAQDSALAALTDRLDSLPAAPDLAPLEQDIAGLRADLVTATDGLRPALDDLAQRLDALERAPSSDGTLSDQAMAAWAADLDALRADLAAQQAQIDDVAAQSTARIDATAEELANIEAQATEAALAAARRGAALQVLAALDAGTPFADPLTEAVGDADRPATLAALADAGAPTLPVLTDTFPEAARAALATARAEGLTDEGQGSFAGFLRTQFDVRSTTPQEGDDPDAILSRAETALRGADLDGALAEIATLPEVVRGAMGDWLTQAQTRQQALAEAAALAETLNVN